MESAFKDWDYIEGMIDSAYHEAALKMNLSDSEFSILYIYLVNIRKDASRVLFIKNPV